jgi:hypothetical protein
MAYNSRSTAEKALKLIYEPGLQKTIPHLVPFFEFLSKKKFPGVGQAYVFATHLKRNTHVAARAHDGYYATAQTETVENGSVKPAYVHIPFEITNDLMKASKGDRAAFKDGMKLVMDTSRETIVKQLNRMSLGDGRGILCTVGANVAGGAATANVTVGAGESTRLLEEGMDLDVMVGTAGVTTRNTAAGPYVRVKSITDSQNFVVEMSDGTNVVALTAGDPMILYGNWYNDNGTRKCYEPYGLRAFADDGTLDPTGGLHGINPTTYGRWKGLVKDAGNIDLSPAIASAVNILFKRQSATQFSACWMHPELAHGLIYGNEGTIKNQRFVSGGLEQLGGNDEALVFHVGGRKVRVLEDVDMLETETYWFDPNAMGYVELNPVELEEQEEGTYLTQYRDATGAKPVQVGIWMWRGNFFVRARNAVARVYGFNKPASLPW